MPPNRFKVSKTVSQKRQNGKRKRPNRYVIDITLAPGETGSAMFTPGVWYATDGDTGFEMSTDATISPRVTFLASPSDLLRHIEWARQWWTADHPDHRWVIVAARVIKRNGVFVRAKDAA